MKNLASDELSLAARWDTNRVLIIILPFFILNAIASRSQRADYSQFMRKIMMQKIFWTTAASSLMVGWSVFAFSVVSRADEGDQTARLRYRTPIPASKQRSGDPIKGYDYIINGDYIKSGVPLDFFKVARSAGSNLLNRSGDSAVLPFNYSAVSAPNGVKVVTANCLSCHAQRFDGKLIIGLGNSVVDFASDRTPTIKSVDKIVSGLYGIESPERLAYNNVRDRLLSVSPFIRTRVRGVNPADTLAYVLAKHRNPDTLEWKEVDLLSTPITQSGAVPTDVPPWWILKKKNAMYYTGFGRGDFSRLMMSSSLLTLKDSDEASEIDSHFPDVLAYINQIEAPSWPKEIDSNLASQGKKVFKK